MDDTKAGMEQSEAGEALKQGYRVLARKYRPQSFEDMVGQDPLVRTLTNAFATGRIAQAYMMTGVRGVGKTTTARILARALNYEIEGKIDTPTIEMKELGIHCQAIMEGRHVDIMEMDAASHTSINDIREIIEAARYKPVSARYKVYIIDEVHMLSTAAFNGLLKTLEEPPEHVKFIFATTEIRKVPVTVLSRCQRFDLRRIDARVMADYMGKICEKEQVDIEEDALQMIARAGEGSARDSLSLLDQAIAHGAGKITAETTRQMLGLADRARIIDLFEALMKGDIAAALQELKEQYDIGAEPSIVLSDLADFVHLVTRLKLTPDAHSDAAATESEKTRGREYAQSLSVRVLSRAWQMLLKGLSEVQSSPRPLASAEMVLVRMAYVADLPTPDEALKMLTNKDFRPPMPSGAGSGPSTPPDATVPASSNGQPTEAPPIGRPSGPTAMARHGNLAAVSGSPQQSVGTIEQAPVKPANLRLVASQSDDALADKQKDASQQQTSKPKTGNMQITRFEQIVGLAGKNRDIALKIALEQNVRPVSVRQGFLEIAFQDRPDQALIAKLNRRLQDWTGQRWSIEVSREHGQDTLSQRKEQAVQKARDDADAHPTVEAVRKHFPGVKIVDVRINRDFEEDYLAPVVEDAAELTDQNLLEMSLRDDDSFGLDDDL
ncbi:DNA polymerase III subunit gamma/tau [Cohaesibacter gelatinilyticus]|uniref:DNA polymerase III subunit gamma/tau n=1 Tax=Cohaesibacter gelatinilyticus TaxID=372072 RepID=A0A285PIP4_9HYPH|nr:DNA polymerase III subunit gamma/tau [Cohaesibacter gelatinilyticus]SNZ21585.1 DNA polymerase III, tau subunit [Cohaesibacter gelatinilyticus]